MTNRECCHESIRVRATEGRHAHGESSSWRFARVFPCIENSEERTLPKWWRPRIKRTREHALEANRESDDELEAWHRENIAMMKRRAEVDQVRQFFRKPQSLEDCKAQLDKLK